MRQIIADGVASGAFGDRDAKLLSFAILGAVNWIPRWFKPDGPASSTEIADGFASYLIAGLRQADGTWSRHEARNTRLRSTG